MIGKGFQTEYLSAKNTSNLAFHAYRNELIELIRLTKKRP